MGRSYDQFCPAARALDVIGGRWTLLIVRELLLGPRRYTDLVAGLPGIGPNVLAERLRELREAGILTQAKLPPPAASTVYELTELGAAMRPLVDELSRWGMRLMGLPRPGERLRLGWVLGCVRASFRPEMARGVHETYEYRVDGEAFHLRVDDGSLEVRHGPAAAPDCVLTADLWTVLAIGSRLLPVREALEGGLARLDGELDVLERAIAILGGHLEATGGRYGIVGAVGASFRPEAARGVHESYEFRVNGGALVFHAVVDDGAVEMRAGAASEPAAMLSTDLATLIRLGAGSVSLEEALARDTTSVAGDPEAGLRMAAAFGAVVSAP
ncbi:winged helix-turn-helix transcriptional regulator [Streptomyces orinoci]|uniref:Winged helix-turn-helix transcriptional regulator n=1 Tax=Streptomyces orinoci TaxID=67339 RepID=A0ABV3K2W2_STRON|nr:winged helix-turn-helix transcriptional regulator [Streptomyces orinoci]